MSIIGPSMDDVTTYEHSMCMLFFVLICFHITKVPGEKPTVLAPKLWLSSEGH